MASKNAMKNRRKKYRRETASAVSWTDPFLLPSWIATWLLHRLVSTPRLLVLARFRGAILYRLKHSRRQTRKQLKAYFGTTKSDAELDQIVQRHFKYQQEFEVTNIWPQRRDFQSLNFRVEGREHLDEALAAEKGAILLTVHFAFGRIAKHMLRNMGIQVSTVGPTGGPDRPTSWSKFRHLVCRRLLRIPLFIPHEDNDVPTGINLRPVLSALRKINVS